jgi:hypothetical protein
MRATFEADGIEGGAALPPSSGGSQVFISDGAQVSASGVTQVSRAASEHTPRSGPDHERSTEPVGPPAGDQADGVRHVGRILAEATTARWPMYLRNVKQILRASDSGFDERRYGFGGLMDLLRACQRENFIRLERDRRGGLRVFQGSALQRTPVPLSEPTDAFESQPIDVSSGPRVQPDASVEADLIDSEPMPTVDPTAELLGRAKARRPRTRMGVSSIAAAPARGKKGSHQSTAGAGRAKTSKPRASTRGKKATADDDQAGNK